MRVTSLVSVLLSLACACGGATSGSSQPASGCDAEPADDINSGCIALKGADFALSLMRVSDEAQRASGYVPISGSGLGNDGAVGEHVELAIGSDQLGAQPRILGFVKSDIQIAGTTSLTFTEYACIKAPPPPSRGVGPQNPGPCTEFSEQKHRAQATAGTVACDASPTRVACRFHDVPVTSLDGTAFLASGWMHTPPTR